MPAHAHAHASASASAQASARARARARVEVHIHRLEDPGLCRMPFSDFEADANSMMTVAMAADLVRWFQLLCSDGSWVNARPKARRWGLFHAPGRLIHKSRQLIVRIIDGRPAGRRTRHRLPAHRSTHLTSLSTP